MINSFNVNSLALAVIVTGCGCSCAHGRIHMGITGTMAVVVALDVAVMISKAATHQFLML